MLDNMFSIKEASKLLDCSTQNIYRQKAELISKNLMEQSDTGSYYITQKGIEYLKEKRIETIKSINQDFNQVDNQDLQSVATPQVSNGNEIITLLKEQLQEARTEKEYYKKQYELKDQELQNKNLYIQELNTKAFALLGTAEQNQKQNEENKKSIWKKIFG